MGKEKEMQRVDTRRLVRDVAGEGEFPANRSLYARTSEPIARRTI